MILSKRELRAGTDPSLPDDDPDTMRLMIQRLRELEETTERVLRHARGRQRREAKRHIRAFVAARVELERELVDVCGRSGGYFLDPALGEERRRINARAIAIAEAIVSFSAGAYKVRPDLVSIRSLLSGTAGVDAKALVSAARADILREVGSSEDPSRALGRLLSEHGPGSPQPLVIAVTPTSVPSVAR